MRTFPDAKIIDVNLTTKKIEIITMSGLEHQLYPGGSALGMYYLLKEVKPNIDPLSPENVMIFTVSPLAGLAVSGFSRMTATTKSPLTNCAGDSQVGGSIAAHFKANGYDAIIVRGKSEKPVYLYVNKDEIKLCDAENVWGKVTGDAEELIRKELNNNKVEIAVIGPAGEKMVRYAAIMHQLNRAFGRNGMGAVMGSKNLKALVINQNKMPTPYDKEKFKEFIIRAKEDIAANDSCMDMLVNGTNGGLGSKARVGFLATRNWQSGWFEEWEEISGPTMEQKIKIGSETCFGCGVKCKQVVEVEGKADPKYGGPEYETVATLGADCGVSDIEAIAHANMLCNMYGLDTISCGATIAFAMECYEKGIISKDMTKGLELKFGNHETFGQIITDIAHRNGELGDLLAEGSYRAAEKLGDQAKEMAITCRMQELPAHMPQHKASLGVIYAVNSFGADHQSSEHDTCMAYALDSKERRWMSQVGGNFTLEEGNSSTLNDSNVIFAYNTQKFYSALDTLSVCQFVWGPTWQLYGPEQLVEICKAAIGWDVSLYELMEIGERRINMMRYFNSRDGYTKKEDTLPERLFVPLEDGPSKGAHVDKQRFEEAKELYYQLAGWDAESGNPTKATLNKLSLGWLLNI